MFVSRGHKRLFAALWNDGDDANWTRSKRGHAVRHDSIEDLLEWRVVCVAGSKWAGECQGGSEQVCKRTRDGQDSVGEEQVQEQQETERERWRGWKEEEKRREERKKERKKLRCW